MSAANIACVVLASGLSERFGDADKLSADLCGQSVLSHVLETAADVAFGEVFCVSKSRGAEDVTWVHNDNPYAGQGHALKLGLAQARSAGWENCAVMLGDMPLICPSNMEKLIEKSKMKQSVVSLYETVRMPPAIFNLDAIDLILSETLSGGARSLFGQLNPIAVPLKRDAAQDVDTPEDLTRCAAILTSRRSAE